ncbi:MFS transporter [Arthrobacter sp. M4]|uniref:MFS transporter n=1 Tax=Arthrobacter sp. M4 TaxID=218160 RepID=UPI0035AC2264
MATSTTAHSGTHASPQPAAKFAVPKSASATPAASPSTAGTAVGLSAAAPTATSATQARSAVVMGILAIVLIGLNLRAGIAGASTLFHDLQAVLGYGPVVASFLPSIPTICFAVAGSATAWLTRRIGVEKAIMLSLALLAGGLLIRGVPSTGMLVIGTVIGMSGLAVCNVALPALIRQHFPDKTSLMTALYTFSMTTGATASSVAMVPLAQQLGSPSLGIASLGLFAVVGMVAFLPLLRRGRQSKSGTAQHVSPWPLLRTRKGALLTAAFTLQALLAYAVMSWFAYILTDQGLSASDSGLQFGLMQLVSVPAGSILIAIGSRQSRLRLAFYLATLTMVVGLAALLVLPIGLAAVSGVFIGFGLGIFPLIMVMISRSGSSTAETTALSTLAQSVGYLLATAGPFGMGLLHSATGHWILPLGLLLAVALVQVVVGHVVAGIAPAPRTTIGTRSAATSRSTK